MTWLIQWNWRSKRNDTKWRFSEAFSGYDLGFIPSCLLATIDVPAALTKKQRARSLTWNTRVAWVANVSWNLSKTWLGTSQVLKFDPSPTGSLVSWQFGVGCDDQWWHFWCILKARFFSATLMPRLCERIELPDCSQNVLWPGAFAKMQGGESYRLTTCRCLFGSTGLRSRMTFSIAIGMVKKSRWNFKLKVLSPAGLLFNLSIVCKGWQHLIAP